MRHLNSNGLAPRVYLAGKIAKNDWRHSLFPGLRGVDLERDATTGAFYVHHRPEADGFRMSGPYMMACDHGCFHGSNSHGIAAHGDREGSCVESYGPWVDWCNPHEAGDSDPSLVAWTCLRWIVESDAVFAWIDDPTAYGSLVEIGFALGLGKLVAVYMPAELRGWQSDLWFIQAVPVRCRFTRSVKEAWQDFTGAYQELGRRAVGLRG